MSRDSHRTLAVFLATTGLTSCSRAPAFDVLGSFFPAWLLCLVVPMLTYPSLTVLFACALWLACFH
jgi:hypothetical protein